MNLNIQNLTFLRNRSDYIYFYRLETVNNDITTTINVTSISNVYKRHLLCKNGSYIKLSALNFLNALYNSFEFDYLNVLHDLIKANYSSVLFFPFSKYIKKPCYVDYFNQLLSQSLDLNVQQDLFDIDFKLLSEISNPDEYSTAIKINATDLSNESIVLYDILFENPTLLKYIDLELRKLGAKNILYLFGTELGQREEQFSEQINSSNVLSVSNSPLYENLSIDDVLLNFNKDSIKNLIKHVADLNESMISPEEGFITCNLEKDMPIEFSTFGPKIIFKLPIPELNYSHLNFNYNDIMFDQDVKGYNISIYKFVNDLITTQNRLIPKKTAFVLVNQIHTV